MPGRLHRHIIRCAAALLAAVLTLCASCSRSGDEPTPPPSGPGTAMLHIQIALANPAGPSRANPADDPLPADDGEKMQLLRIIILDGNGYAEHNSLWDLRSAPDITAAGQAFPVRANDTKTIIFVANEHSECMDGVRDELSGINAAVGEKVDLARLQSLLLDAPVTSPLPISAVYTYHIGPATAYRATFLIHRAAVKYSFRITNNDSDEPHRVDYVAIDNAATTQYLLPDADYTADDQTQWSAYRVPATAGAEQRTYGVNADIAYGNTLELPAIYLPEGRPGTDSYHAGISVDGNFLGWAELRDENGKPMTDLPRNTHVVINITLNLEYSDFKINYTVCPWQTEEIDIPDFD